MSEEEAPAEAAPARPRIFESRNASLALAALLLVYTAGFLLFYPPTVTIADEGNYVRQAQLLLHGGRMIDLVDPFTGETIEVLTINDYPLGTAILMAPFVAVGGREAAHLLSLLCTVVAVIVTARWLHELRHSPLWAALVLAYPATAIMGRVAMSEAPSLMVVSLGLWLYWRGTSGQGAAFFASGFLAGFSFALREANVLLFAPLFLGSALRHDPRWPLLVAGGALGLGVRLVSAWLFFDDPLFTKPPDPFLLAAVLQGAPLYIACLLVLVPGGLVSAFAYRGSRRVEVQITIAIFVVLHLLYGYSAVESGFAKRLILGPRYFIPLLPFFALCAAEVWPRLARARFARSSPARQGSLLRAVQTGVPAALVAVAIGFGAIHWVHADWAGSQAAIRDAIYETSEDGAVLVGNSKALGKFMDHVFGNRWLLHRDRITPVHMRRLIERHGHFYIVLLDRTDSSFWRRDAAENSAFMSRLALRREQIVDLQVTPTDHLRIWRVTD